MNALSKEFEGVNDNKVMSCGAIDFRRILCFIRIIQLTILSAEAASEIRIQARQRRLFIATSDYEEHVDREIEFQIVCNHPEACTKVVT